MCGMYEMYVCGMCSVHEMYVCGMHAQLISIYVWYVCGCVCMSANGHTHTPSEKAADVI